jgi:DNA-binding response OmpR family regulator
MSDAHILLVDDEKGITDYLAAILERAGFSVTVARDGKLALHKVAALQPDLIVLDVLMPVMDGRQVCRQLRAAGDWTPVIMLTCVNETVDKVLSLEEGADDYLCKPFDPQELIARIRAVLRRKSNSTPGKPLSMSLKLRSGDLVLDRKSRRVEKGGQVIELTHKALSLLEYLMVHPDQVFSREQLLDAVWGWAKAVATRAVDVRIAELRQEVVEAAQDHPGYLERSLKLTLLHSPWRLSKVRGDRGLLWLACFNLVDNALKFTPPECQIEVRAFEVNPWLVMEVTDNGPGIQPEDLPYVFEELYRGKNARGCPGSGLGLPLVRTIVIRHEGRIDIRSRQGQGTVFAMHLPAVV